MDLYIERNEKRISLQEWLAYVAEDNDLVLSEVWEGVNPISKQKLRIEMPGRVIFKGNDFHYRNGRVGCEGSSEEILAKLREIAVVLNANVYDCGEIII